MNDMRLSNEEYLKKLNNDFDIILNNGQEQSVLTIDGPILVIAVPGAGKTFSICVRLHNMIWNYGIEPNKILAVTFSKESAKDMSKKFANMFEDVIKKEIVGYGNNPVKFSTIHSFSYKIVRDYSYKNNIHYEIIERKKRETINNIYKRLCFENITDDIYDSITSAISYVKNKLLSKEEIESNCQEVHNKFFAIFNEYEEYKKKNNYIDYDDMLCMALDILNSDNNIREKYTNMFEYIIVDEAQDTSNVQFEIIKIISEKYNNICCVGDDDQSIYEWRSADVDNFLYFDRYFPNTKKIFMEQNYRSTQKIIETSNSFIKSNEKRYNKDMFTENEVGNNINIVECKSYIEQVEFIIHQLKDTKNLKDNAIIFRNNISAFAISNIFIKKNIPFYIRGYNEKFFNHWILQDLMAFLNFSMYPRDFKSFERIAFKMDRYISRKMLNYIQENEENKTIFEKLLDMQSLKTYQRENILTLRQEFTRLKNKHTKYAINYICDQLGYASYLEKMSSELGFSFDSLKEIVFIIKEIASDCESVADFEEKIYSFQDELDNAINNYNKNVVTLTTAHSSKGLEWNNVYMVDLNEGVFPSYKAINLAKENDHSLLESERRLYYVGMTRAKNNLHLIHCNFKNGHSIKPSLFTKEVFNCGQDNVDTKTFSLYKEEDKVQLFNMDPERIKTLSTLSLDSYDFLDNRQASLFDDKPKRKYKKKSIPKESKIDDEVENENENDKYLIGEVIKHKTLGEGVIKKRRGQVIEVLFDDYDVRKFNIDICEMNGLFI